MKCTTSDIEIETIIIRINNGDLDLQPNFQRGEVWTIQKKKKLVDSILRGWRIPPIHVVRNNDNSIDEVLDGQQRLAAIRDFVSDIFPVDGNVEPADKEIKELDKIFFSDLPISVRRKFNQYPISLVRLTEYNPMEPAELFYRLNQPTALTSAERRNAYIGETRNQVKSLVSILQENGGNKDTLGFSNSRLAYDEVLSKFAYAIEAKSLKKKITASEISERFRLDEKFSDSTMSICKSTTKHLMLCLKECSDARPRIRLNKATLFSWLVFFKTNKNIPLDLSSEMLIRFEVSRNQVKGKAIVSDVLEIKDASTRTDHIYPYIEVMLTLFNQRSSMGSTDALSVIYRDIILHLFYDMQFNQNSLLLKDVDALSKNYAGFSQVLEQIANLHAWGEDF